MIWLAFALLTGLALFSILWPLSHPAPKPREDAADVAFYRAQIAEIDAELSRGAVDAEQAEAAKALAARRLLATAPEEVAREESARTRKIAAALALLLVPALTLLIYGVVGHPDQPDMPLEARLKQPPADMDIATAVAKIEAHIAAHPEDGRAYEVVAPVYLRLGRLDAAAHAREEAVRLLGATPERLTKYAVALTFAADGMVSPEAEIQLDRALKIDPKFMEARYFVGLAAAQHDERERAREIWTAMLAELPANSPIRREVVEKIAMLDAPVEGAPPPANAPPSAAPSQAAVAAVAAQPADQQQKTINAMVERLAQRLATQGGSVDDWMRLIRAYKVLNEVDKSQGALAEAGKALKDDPAGQAKLAALAQELGLKAQ